MVKPYRKTLNIQYQTFSRGWSATQNDIHPLAQRTKLHYLHIYLHSKRCCIVRKQNLLPCGNIKKGLSPKFNC